MQGAPFPVLREQGLWIYATSLRVYQDSVSVMAVQADLDVAQLRSWVDALDCAAFASCWRL